MYIFLIVLSGIFMLYFLAAGSYARFNCSFIWFWPLLSLALFILGIGIKSDCFLYVPVPFKVLFLGVIFTFITYFVYIEIQIIIHMLKPYPADLDGIIVLGARVKKTKITRTLKKRLICALDAGKINSTALIVVSGGMGPGEEITEAKAMKDFLTENGIDAYRILMEDNSYNTYENLVNSKKILYTGKKLMKIGICTSNFHIYRALKIAKLAGIEDCYGISAGSVRILLPNYMTREFFAILKFNYYRIKEKFKKSRKGGG
ncbi:Uncharacterized SAM-binding protein YcdF, DUF218 family [Acetitomaculum ruminis DSM 5522]|uniref:Uncharacterized SAM-binding protein YcdF, DUF218 family n=1 Tax=Acetitomaculum ruminis DSM 5522 TaxID=1120918 RepID=A0A1I0VV64_9FIRM|nr:YdcF family protein [Acetitomaculum ruminis]SFA80315.1 Uncharacterized SAM-binding protein YcdF, DUF218 family [Acetitomaculum ruminis DSM 5522]